MKHLIPSLWCPAHMGTKRPRSRFAIRLFSIKCHHTGTFPAVSSLQHPLVIAIVWGHPLSAHIVSGEIPVPLLLRGHCQRLSAHGIIIIILLMGYPWWFSPWRKSLPFLCLVAPKVYGLVASIHSALHKPMIALCFLPLNLLTPLLGLARPSFCFFPLPFPFSRSLYSFHSKWCLWAMKSGPVLLCDVRVCT